MRTLMKFSIFIALNIAFLSFAHTQSLHVTHNIEESVDLAQKDGKNILMVFSGSDWCKPCIQLRKNILQTEAFIPFAEKHLVVLELDFPYSRKNKLSREQEKHNERLADLYNPEGSFPKIILLDEDQNKLGVLAYQKKQDVQEFIEMIKSILVL